MMKTIESAMALVCLCFLSCGGSEIKPVDLYPEDMCSFCRMAVSNRRFASEIITVNHDALKFDDIGCMERYRAGAPDLKIAAIFLGDFAATGWLRAERSVIVETGIATPMGSGKVAFPDSAQAIEFLNAHPRHQQ